MHAVDRLGRAVDHDRMVAIERVALAFVAERRRVAGEDVLVADLLIQVRAVGRVDVHVRRLDVAVAAAELGRDRVRAEKADVPGLGARGERRRRRARRRSSIVRMRMTASWTPRVSTGHASANASILSRILGASAEQIRAAAQNCAARRAR